MMSYMWSLCLVMSQTYSSYMRVHMHGMGTSHSFVKETHQTHRGCLGLIKQKGANGLR